MNTDQLAEKIGIVVGEASMCWSEVPKGVFDSTKAAAIAKRIFLDAYECFNSWENFERNAKTVLAFDDLSPEKKEVIMLMIDGLKFRRHQSEVEQRIEHE